MNLKLIEVILIGSQLNFQIKQSCEQSILTIYYLTLAEVGEHNGNKKTTSYYWWLYIKGLMCDV
jgi:hypothetical protein